MVLKNLKWWRKKKEEKGTTMNGVHHLFTIHSLIRKRIRKLMLRWELDLDIVSIKGVFDF